MTPNKSRNRGSTNAVIAAVQSECKRMVRYGMAGDLTWEQVDQYVNFHAKMQQPGWWWYREHNSLNWWCKAMRQWCVAYAEVAA